MDTDTNQIAKQRLFLGNLFAGRLGLIFLCSSGQENQELFWQTKPKEARFANFRGRSPEPVPEPPFACKCYAKPLEKGVPELFPDSVPESSRTSLWCAGTTPILEKTLRECWGKWESFMWVSIKSGNRYGSCSENCGVRIAQVVRCHSENGISYSENGISNSENCPENTPELSESSENGLFTPRAFSWNWGGPEASDWVTFFGLVCRNHFWEKGKGGECGVVVARSPSEEMEKGGCTGANRALGRGKGQHFLDLVSHYSGIGDTISRDVPYSAIGFRV